MAKGNRKKQKKKQATKTVRSILRTATEDKKISAKEGRKIKNAVKGSGLKVKSVMKLAKKFAGRTDSELTKRAKKQIRGIKKKKDEGSGLPELDTSHIVLEDPDDKISGKDLEDLNRKSRKEALEMYRDRKSRPLPGKIGDYESVPGHKEFKKRIQSQGKGGFAKKTGKFKGGTYGSEKKLRINQGKWGKGEVKFKERGLKNDPYGNKAFENTFKRYNKTKPQAPTGFGSSINTTKIKNKFKTSLASIG